MLIDKETYKNKIKDIISDSGKFEKLNIEEDKQLNFLINSEKKLKDILKKFFKIGCLDKDKYDLISPTGSKPGIVYGLAKVHKPVVGNCPSFRPILSAIGTSTYNLAKFLVPILKPLTINEFTVKDSFSFANEVTTFDKKCIMASLDIESLFTIIPLDETIDNCIYDLFQNNSKVSNFDQFQLKELLSFAANESFFIFDKEYFRQKDGVAMGSPLGPTLANAFLCHYEKQWLSSCPENFRPKVYRRYVDDIFVTFDSIDQLKMFVDYMNSRHSSMKFTFEIEKQDTFSFLDIKICRENDKITTSVYRKPTFSGVFTNFDSFIPDIYKNGLVNTLLFRSFSICSSYEKFHNEIVYLKEVLKRNGYPVTLIDNCIKLFLDRLFIYKKTKDTVDKKQLLIVLPYLGKQSLLIRKRLQSCIKNNLPYCSLRIVFQSKTRLSTLFRFKDVIPKDICSHIVYKFVCSCCNATYYGESERHFHIRASEHLGITPLTVKRVANPKKSYINDHMLYKNHDASYDDFSILTRENNKFKLRIKESLLIKRDKPDLNRNIYSFPLELFD